MTYPEDDLRYVGPSLSNSWSDSGAAADEQGEKAPHVQGIRGNVGRAETPDAFTMLGKIESSGNSRLPAPSTPGQALDALAMPMYAHENSGMKAMAYSLSRLSTGWSDDGSHDAGGRVRSKWQHQLWHLVQPLAIAFTLAAAAILIITLGQGGGEVTFPSNATDGATAADGTQHSRGRFRSESLTMEDNESATALSSALQRQSRSLSDASLIVSAHSGDGGFERRARIGYLIMLSGVEELHKTKRLLKAIYDPENFYLVHLDRKDSLAVRRDMEDFIEGWDNVRMLVPALDVSWGGYTITLTAIFGICTMVQWSDEWDFFINLSASDFPLLPQSELRTVLGQYADVGMNFVSGAPLNERNRVEVMIDDQGLYRETQSSKAGRPLMVAKPRLPPSKSMFTVFKGEFWVVLHRSFCRYIEASPDNVARSLQAYFSRFRISDESYFQTVLCHPLAPSFRVHPDNLRFVSWPDVSEGYYVLHPDPIKGGESGNVNEAINSGALFARKFDSKVSQEAYAELEQGLSTSNPRRQARVANRLSPAGVVTGRQRFCTIPDDYSIQEVLSHPPKKPAMGLIEGKQMSDMSPVSNLPAGSPPLPPPAIAEVPHFDQSHDQTREALEGSGSNRR